MVDRHRWQHTRVWVIGGSTGIGREIVELLGAAGSIIAVSARNPQLLDQMVANAKSTGQAIHVYPLDVTDSRACVEVSAHVTTDFDYLDYVIYCPGAWSPIAIDPLDAVQVAKQMDVNFLGFVRIVSAVLPKMIERNGGTIVGTSSASAYFPLPTAEGYGASKAAMNYFIRSLRFDLRARAIRVVSAIPGFVETPLTRQNEFHMPFIMTASNAARIIIRGLEQRKTEIDFPIRLTWPMRLLGSLPQTIQARIIGKLFRAKGRDFNG